ncbi:hypothetical protein [Nostoc punctiforme]|uniref:hypothetical protein n=1 Tax=Nostoc punctiforme TaxID=272131 RepID=UPI000038D7B9|nr:hypothetical protein [Nostoc punctiforme]
MARRKPVLDIATIANHLATIGGEENTDNSFRHRESVCGKSICQKARVFAG